MAEVTLSVGGHHYKVSCRDGEEAHLHRLAAFVDGKVREARSAVGDLGEVRQLLLASLLLADEHMELVAAPPAPSSVDDEMAQAIETIAVRLESVAVALENSR